MDENENQIIGRRLPPELLAEIHKCLPLADAINVLVNVPTRAIYQNNSPRMRRTIQRIKTFLKKYIDTMVNNQEDEEQQEFLEIFQSLNDYIDELVGDEEELIIRNEIEWKPVFDALLRYGVLISKRDLLIIARGSKIVGVPENFVIELLLHLANSRSIQMMIENVQMIVRKNKAAGALLPVPLLLKQFFEIDESQMVGGRFIFESMELAAEDGQILHIYEAELFKYNSGCYLLRLVGMNKIHNKNWFEFRIFVSPSKNSIWRLEFAHWKSQSVYDFVNAFVWLKKEDNKLEVLDNIAWNAVLDVFLRRGAGYSQFRHFKIILPYYLCDCPPDYDEFLINYISNAKHPEEFLDSIEINLLPERCSSFMDKFEKICGRGIPEGGKFLQLETKKFHILSAKTTMTELKLLEDSSGLPIVIEKHELKFTLANIPTNGEYLFDVVVYFGYGTDWIDGIKIQKRKEDNKLEALDNFALNTELDVFLRRGAGYTNYRHFKVIQPYYLCEYPPYFNEFLINYISNTKHPEEFLDSIEINLKPERCTSFMEKFWEICRRGIPADGGKFMNIEATKLHILSAKTTKSRKKEFDDFGRPQLLKYLGLLEFTLANIPTKGAYLFDVIVHFSRIVSDQNQIVGIKIQKRKNVDNVVLKCDELGSDEEEW